MKKTNTFLLISFFLFFSSSVVVIQSQTVLWYEKMNSTPSGWQGTAPSFTSASCPNGNNYCWSLIDGLYSRADSTQLYTAVQLTYSIFGVSLNGQSTCSISYSVNNIDFTPIVTVPAAMSNTDITATFNTWDPSIVAGIPQLTIRIISSKKASCHFNEFTLSGTPQTSDPTSIPTQTPSKTPTQSPTKNPSITPTQTPTNYPSLTPTKYPTEHPSLPPNSSPSRSPSKASFQPTLTPTIIPTPLPSYAPSIITVDPTLAPTSNHLSNPTDDPTTATINPTTVTLQPTKIPTSTATNPPTNVPTDSPHILNTPVPTTSVPTTHTPTTSKPTTVTTSWPPTTDTPSSSPNVTGIPTLLPISDTKHTTDAPTVSAQPTSTVTSNPTVSQSTTGITAVPTRTTVLKPSSISNDISTALDTTMNGANDKGHDVSDLDTFNFIPGVSSIVSGLVLIVLGIIICLMVCCLCKCKNSNKGKGEIIRESETELAQDNDHKETKTTLVSNVLLQQELVQTLVPDAMTAVHVVTATSIEDEDDTQSDDNMLKGAFVTKGNIVVSASYDNDSDESGECVPPPPEPRAKCVECGKYSTGKIYDANDSFYCTSCYQTLYGSTQEF